MTNPEGSRDDVTRCGGRLFIVGLVLILAATQFPYDFRFVRFGTLSSSNDFLTVHVLLFVLPGFATACWIHRSDFGRWGQLRIILAVGVCLSIVTEGLQAFLPTRSVSLGDAAANLVGVFLGFWLFQVLGLRILRSAANVVASITRLLTLRILGACFFGYAILMCLVSISLQQATSLSNWGDFALMVGNERTGDRPWRGQVDRIQIADRAITEEEVVKTFTDDGVLARIAGPLACSYDLTATGKFSDRSGHLPDLVWQGADPERLPAPGARVGSGRWLTTTAPVDSLTKSLQKTSQFTVSVTLATEDTVQDGPARIVSLSADPARRNFTLGQEESHLVVRLRTPLTGENGSNPELIFSDVFADSKPHHLVVTYDGSHVNLFQDGVRHSDSFQLTPAAALVGHLFPLNAFDMKGYTTVYYACIFVPLGVLLAHIVAISKMRSTRRSLILGLGIVIPSIVFESVLASVGERPLVDHHLLLGMAFTGSPLLCDYVVSRLRR